MSDSALRKATLSRELKFARSHVVALLNASNNLEVWRDRRYGKLFTYCTVAQDTKAIRALTKVL